jgi:hypothetical protein
MADDVLWRTLTGLNVTFAQRWCSAWGDLLSADMVLNARLGLANTPANLFQRRALWESAVACYGRLIVSDQKRKIPFKEFVEEITGVDGLAIHERIMDWRQGHVVHRTDAEFESIETVLAFAQGSAAPTGLHIVLGTDLGPEDDSEFVVSFREHVKTLRDAIYEKRLRPLGVSIIEDLNKGRITLSEPRAAEDQSSGERYVINHCLLGATDIGPINST